jgi:hypothetical protein
MENKLQIPEEKLVGVKNDTRLLADKARGFLSAAFPYSSVPAVSDKFLEPHSKELLRTFKFYRIETCTIENTENVFEYLNNNVQKYLAAAYSINAPIVFGIESLSGKTSLILGIDPLAEKNEKNENKETIKKIVQGLLPDVRLSDFQYQGGSAKKFGIIAGTPSYTIEGKRQTFDYSTLMRGLNGENYTLLVFAKPIPPIEAQKKIVDLTAIKDECLAVSKRNISLQQSLAHTKGDTVTKTEGHNINVNVNANTQMNVGIPLLFSVGVGYGVGAGYGYSWGESISKSISDTITNGKSIGLEIQNGFALDIAKRVENAVLRLQKGLLTGLWQTAVCYSAETDIALKVIQGSIYGEIAKADALSLPPRVFDNSQIALKERHALLIPKNILSNDGKAVDICSYANSEELSLLLTFPDKNVPGYELRTGKRYPVSIAPPPSNNENQSIVLGNICDASNRLDNIPFYLSESDLNKHTFVCGITGSGKTNTVKHILGSLNKPFWVVECAKKEYRSLKLKNGTVPEVYTLGVPEINCLSLNPFYIMPGISPQMHIDYLKDLFNASFSFYASMPHILEKCLHNIYIKRGWNLSLGFHPYLANTKSILNRYDSEFIKERYNRKEHYYLFPTMTDLKNEVDTYVKTMGYEGEVKANIRTAMLARIDSLCVGAKGFMLNTNDFPDFTDLTKNNIVYELEGLADDSDKAFSIGILIIFLTEYRFIEKERSFPGKLELKHLLVIEEAHRLLKNISTEKTNEDLGNPKGKAIEHFTNMIAEMRSFGQGVVIAEQIPSKLAPDVIKNASNKIIHRIVARDDQELIANMIGMEAKDALFLGDQITGRALCHAEGMRLPVSTAIPELKEHVERKDSALREKDPRKNERRVLKSMVYPCLLDNNEGIEDKIPKLMNSFFTFCSDYIKKAVDGDGIMADAQAALKKQEPSLLRINQTDDVIREIIAELIIKFLLQGEYRRNDLPPDLFDTIIAASANPYKHEIEALIEMFKTIDGKENILKNVVAERYLEKILDCKEQEKKYDERELIESFFYAGSVSDEIIDGIKHKIEEHIKRIGGKL